MRTEDRSRFHRKALAWVTLAFLGSAFAPGAAAGDCLLSCDVGDTVGEVVDTLPEVEVPEVPEVEVPEVEVPDVEVPEVEVPELPEVELPGTPEVPELPEEPEVPEVPTDPGEVVQGPSEPDLEEPSLEIPTPVAGSGSGNQPPPKGPQSSEGPRQLHPVSVADGIAKPAPVELGNDPGHKSPTVGTASGASDRVADALLRVPSDPAPRDADLTFGSVDTIVQAVARTEDTARPSLPAQLADLAARTVKHVAFPIGLALAVIGFLMVQRRIDGRDPKLRVAPVATEYDHFS